MDSDVVGYWQRYMDGEFSSFAPEVSRLIEEAFRYTPQPSVDVEAINCSIHFDTMRDSYSHPVRRISYKTLPDQRWEYQELNYWMDFNVHSCEFLSIMTEAGRERSILYDAESFHEIHIDMSQKRYYNSNIRQRGMIRAVPTAVPTGLQRRLMIDSVLSNMLSVDSIAPDDVCAICMDGYRDEQHSAFQLPSCIHHFHKHCIRQQVHFDNLSRLKISS